MKIVTDIHCKNCQRLSTHCGSMLCNAKAENKTLRLVLTFYRQVANILPTHHQLLANCRPTGGLCLGQNLLTFNPGNIFREGGGGVRPALVTVQLV